MILDDHRVTVEPTVEAGITTLDSQGYDTSGFSEICFVVQFNPPDALNNIRVQQATELEGRYEDLAGTQVNDPAKPIHMIAISRMQERWIRCRVTRGTPTGISTFVVIQSRPRTFPVVQPDDVVYEQYLSPAEGDAAPGEPDPPKAHIEDRMELVEALTRKLAKHAIIDGRLGLNTDGDPTLLAAFLFLGWDDPHIDPDPEPEPEPEPEPAPEPAPEPMPV